MLKLRAEHGLTPDRIVAVECPVPEYFLSVVCEPADEKRRPLTDSHGRVSLYFSLAEALVTGRLGKDAYGREALADPAILSLADKVSYTIDPDMPGTDQFKGVVRIRLSDGTELTHVEEHNRGSRQNPMTEDELWSKFAENAGDLLDEAGVKRLGEAILALESADDASAIVPLTVPR